MCTATDQFLGDHDCREQNRRGEEGPSANEDETLEPGIKDDPEDDEHDYGYSKQAVEDEEVEDEDE
jgi:hypothetical protein